MYNSSTVGDTTNVYLTQSVEVKLLCSKQSQWKHDWPMNKIYCMLLLFYINMAKKGNYRASFLAI